MAIQFLRAPGCLRCGPRAEPRISTPSYSVQSNASSLSSNPTPSVALVCFERAPRERLTHSVSFSSTISSTKPLHSLMGWGQRSARAGGVARAAGFFNLFGGGKGKQEKVKVDLLSAIAPLARGAKANADDIATVDEIAQELEKLNPTRDPLNSSLVNGKWKLIYTTSESVLQKKRPELLRPRGPIYQAINTDTLRAENFETWPFFNQVTADLEPISGKKVLVNFDYFKIGGLIKVKAPGRAQGELEITYLDDAFRISRGDRGNLYILVMEDPEYRIPD